MVDYFQVKFYKELQEAAIGSQCPLLVAKIYKNYFQEIPYKNFHRHCSTTHGTHVNDCSINLKQDPGLPAHHHLNSVGMHIMFTIKTQGPDSGIQP